MPTFEIFDRTTSSNGDPQVTILRAGMLSLNQAAFAALGHPDAAELMFDRTKQIIGLHAVATSTRHAYFLRPASRAGHGNVLITAKAFLHYYKIDTEVSRRWPAWFEDEILCISLEQQSTVVTSNRAAHRSA